MKVSEFLNRDRFDQNSFRVRFDAPSKTVVIFGPIDWDYRHQRPQNLAHAFSKMGLDVFYVNPTICSRINSSVEVDIVFVGNVRVCTIYSNYRKNSFYIGTAGFPTQLAGSVSSLIESLVANNTYSSVILLVGQPSWWPLIERLQGNQIIFDCMDLHSGFRQIDPRNVILEEKLDSSSDLITVTSEFLLQAKLTTFEKNKNIRCFSQNI
jgi:hypothetical protein